MGDIACGGHFEGLRDEVVSGDRDIDSTLFVAPNPTSLTCVVREFTGSVLVFFPVLEFLHAIKIHGEGHKLIYGADPEDKGRAITELCVDQDRFSA